MDILLRQKERSLKELKAEVTKLQNQYIKTKNILLIDRIQELITKQEAIIAEMEELLRVY